MTWPSPEVIPLFVTREQHVTIVAALALAAQQYKDPELVLETIEAVAPGTSEGLRKALEKVG
jgi:hypothetical protein